jgi:hypothetical protein
MAVGNFRITSIVRVNALTNNAGTVVRTQLYLCNAASFEPQISDITYEGDGTELIVFQATGFTAELEFDSLPLGLLTAFGKTPVTTGLSAGETDRVYWMADADAAGVVCGLEVLCSVIDDTANANKFLGIVVPVGTLSTLTPPELASSDKATTALQFSGRKTATDIAGAALPGVPSGGAFWYYSVRTALP